MCKRWCLYYLDWFLLSANHLYNKTKEIGRQHEPNFDFLWASSRPNIKLGLMIRNWKRLALFKPLILI